MHGFYEVRQPGNHIIMQRKSGGDTTTTPVPPASPKRPEPQCAMNTGTSACERMWLVAPPKIICRNRLCV